jgi:hypothetical protein
MRYQVKRTGTPKRPFEVWDTAGGWVCFCSKNEATATKEADFLERQVKRCPLTCPCRLGVPVHEGPTMTSQDKDANAVTPKARIDDAVFFGEILQVCIHGKAIEADCRDCEKGTYRPGNHRLAPRRKAK